MDRNPQVTVSPLSQASFELWCSKVNLAVEGRAGCSLGDLPDVPPRSRKLLPVILPKVQRVLTRKAEAAAAITALDRPCDYFGCQDPRSYVVAPVNAPASAAMVACPLHLEAITRIALGEEPGSEVAVRRAS